jgi:hypothetical protein
MYIKLRNNNVFKKKKANNKPLELTEVKMGGAIKLVFIKINYLK